MDTIVSQISEILTKEESILQRESQLNHFFSGLFCQLARQALELLDRQLIPSMKAQGYQIDHALDRKVSFFFGPVTYRRRRYVKTGSPAVYPVDELLNLEPKKRHSKYVQNVFAQASTLGVYRKVSEAIDLVSMLSISHQQLQQLATAVGEEIDQNQRNDLSHNPKSGEKKVPILYVEGDAFYVGAQGGGNIAVHRYQVCEGRQRIGKSRTTLVNYKEFIDLDRETAFEQLQNYLESTYDLSNTLLVTNSDEGTGYQKHNFSDLAGSVKAHEHFVDRYHVNRKIKARLRFVPEDLVKEFQKALWQYDSTLLSPLYDTLESLCETAKDSYELGELKKYIGRNWLWLKPFWQRPLLKGHESVIGTCESHHRYFTFRMKKQGRRWGERGAQAMVKLLSAKRNGEFDKYTDYVSFPEFEAQEYDWQKLQKEYQKPLSECKKKTKWNYSETSQAHLVSPRLRIGFRI